MARADEPRARVPRGHQHGGREHGRRRHGGRRREGRTRLLEEVVLHINVGEATGQRLLEKSETRLFRTAKAPAVGTPPQGKDGLNFAECPVKLGGELAHSFLFGLSQEVAAELAHVYPRRICLGGGHAFGDCRPGNAETNSAHVRAAVGPPAISDPASRYEAKVTASTGGEK